jgi:hypothetical protein
MENPDAVLNRIAGYEITVLAYVNSSASGDMFLQ